MSQALTAALQNLRSASSPMDARPGNTRSDDQAYPLQERPSGTCTIGVLVDDLSHPVRRMMLQGIEQATLVSNCLPLYSGEPWSADLDALLVLDDRITETSLRDLAEVMPLIILGRRVRGLEQQCLWMDQVEAVREAATHLFEQGHQNVVFLGRSEEDVAGHRLALLDAGRPVHEHLIVTGCTSEAQAHIATLQLLEAGVKFTAVLTASDPLAYGARKALHHSGLEVPQDVALMGIGDLPFSAFLTPPLSSVGVGWTALAREATFALLKMVRGERWHLPDVQLDLQVRDSTLK